MVDGLIFRGSLWARDRGETDAVVFGAKTVQVTDRVLDPGAEVGVCERGGRLEGLNYLSRTGGHIFAFTSERWKEVVEG